MYGGRASHRRKSSNVGKNNEAQVNNDQLFELLNPEPPQDDRQIKSLLLGASYIDIINGNDLWRWSES
jgi:hypothetical protein